MGGAVAAGNGVVRIAATGDLHFAKHPPPPAAIHELFAQVGQHADVLLVCGDLTDRGLPEEAHLLARAIAGTVKVPVVAVLGNHDYESGKPEEVKNILADAGITLLDGDAQVVEGIGFAGVKGFAGGFGKRALGPWGETIIKDFVREAVDEALKLESALARLRRVPRVAVLHYSPIQETVEGEPCEIFPFLGCSRLEEPLSRYPVSAVFHGHAHRGRPEGRTAAGAPVYNVAMGVLQRTHPDRLPFRVVEVRREPD
ncbi:MAG TPA: metallophosphoesterase [Thermoanaerobaculia bacterium]|nr:metallophosphoesterase [Thermoanaerobaculia bacterium]